MGASVVEGDVVEEGNEVVVVGCGKQGVRRWEGCGKTVKISGTLVAGWNTQPRVYVAMRVVHAPCGGGRSWCVRSSSRGIGSGGTASARRVRLVACVPTTLPPT